MPEKILGIDIGSHSLKMVQVSRGFRTSQISGYAVSESPPNGNPAQITRTLMDLISENNLESDHYLVGIGTQEAFLRRLSFPFSAERKIDQVIRFELEPMLPLGIDDLIVDFVKTDQRQDGAHGVLAAAIPKRFLDPLLTELQDGGLVCEVVDLDASGLNMVANEVGEQLGERLVILDIGHHKTNMFYRAQGCDTYVRSLMFGCERMAGTIADTLGVSPDEGMQRLLAMELDGQAEEPVERSGQEAVAKEVESLTREVEMSLLSARIQEQPVKPEAVILTGGGSFIKGFSAALEKQLDAPVYCLGDLEDLGHLDQLRDQFSDAQVMATAAGLALRWSNRRAGFNFQTDDSLKQRPFAEWRGYLKYALVGSAIVLISWFGSVGVEVYTKKQRLSQLDQGIETVFHRALPSFKGHVRKEQYASILKARINDMRQSVALFGTEAGQDSVIELLRQLSQAISADLDVTINLLTVDSQHVRLNGKADGFNTVDGVKNRLEASRNFDKITITGAKAARDGKGVQFSLEFLRHPFAGESP